MLVGSCTKKTEEKDWQEEILTYLKHGTLPEDIKEARKLVQKSAWYTIIEE